MEVKVNKEVRDYTESIFFGLSMRQCICSLVACIVAVGIYFLTIDTLGTELTSWLCMLGALPFAMIGFVKYQGLNAEQILITAWRSFLLSKRDLISKPYNLYFEVCGSILEQEKRKVLQKDDKKLRKIKKSK